MTRISICALLALAVITVGASAQCPGLSPTTSLTLNSVDPGTVMGGVLDVGAPYSVDLSISDSSGGNFPLILLGGSNINCNAIAPAGTSISVDMDGAHIILDGMNPANGVSSLSMLGNTPLDLSISFPSAVWQGLNGPALQAVIFDPAAGAVPYYTTAAGQPYFANSVSTTYILPDDGGVAHTLAGAGISFGGVMQNPICMNSNGQITFGAIVNDFSPTLAEHFNGWGSAGNNGVSVMYEDLNRSGQNSSTTITEHLITGDVTVNYDNQNHWNANEPAGNFAAVFSGMMVTLDYTSFLGQVNGTDNFIIGVTDGYDSLTTGTGTDTDLSVATGGTGLLAGINTYVSAGADDSIAEEFLSTDAAALIAQGTISFLDAGMPGGAYIWVIM